MPEKWCSLLLGLFVLSLASVTSSTSSNELFTSSFLVRFKRTVDNNEAHEIAKRNSFHNIGPVSAFLSCFNKLRVVLSYLYCWLPSVHPTLIIFLIHHFQIVGKLTEFSSSCKYALIFSINDYNKSFSVTLFCKHMDAVKQFVVVFTLNCFIEIERKHRQSEWKINVIIVFFTFFRSQSYFQIHFKF